MARELVHVAGHERGEDVMVRHEDEFLVGELPRDHHERVEELGVGGVCAHVADIEKV